MRSKFLITVLAALVLCMSSTVQAKIVEIQSAEEILGYGGDRTLVIFDIDSTILEPVQEVGREEWFLHRKKIHQAMGSAPDKALERAYEEWTAIHNVAAVRLIEPAMKRVLEELQRMKAAVIGLTWRPACFANATIRQLKSLTFDLNRSSPLQREICFLPNGKASSGLHFKEGVLFAGGLSSSEALSKLLRQMEERPQTMLYVHRDAGKLAEVERYCEQEGISFIGLRYAFRDSAAPFSAELADVQWRYFGSILSDEDAQKLLTH